MNSINNIQKAVHRCGGATFCSFLLRVNPQTIHKWVRQGYIPKLDKAQLLSKHSGVDVELLRPTYQIRGI